MAMCTFTSIPKFSSPSLAAPIPANRSIKTTWPRASKRSVQSCWLIHCDPLRLSPALSTVPAPP
eukprot:3969301-Amphidinium_carterae.1